ncbi:subclass B1 metallo-beta-lactamase [Taibaiella chishuiensis]|uniref:beta-lactamase n=1 Tax=Taibaiella chishuiensis TaxID=1434707 RepID=A0A2P8CZJ1_9BACT|nr:subclass B1 metallo-beta-lactamase [Taibaiella chishuiensis]PSK90389.1 metallo-beta-lactamase class B [Taibaiella chishuiensis]
MNIILKTLLVLLCASTVVDCSARKKDKFKAEVVYKSRYLVISKVSAHAFEHTSYLQTQDYGKVPCNGLVVIHNQEAIVFDTPTDDTGSLELINWITKKQHAKVNAVIPTHFHNDCLGGLKAFDDHHIPSYAYIKTIELAKANHYVVPQNGFSDSLALTVGGERITAKFFGEGHTRDNVVGYFPAEHVMFGGCLVKELDATKGYLGDANVADWSGTVERVKKAYPDVKIIIPGHGDYGNQALLDYTINLFRKP